MRLGKQDHKFDEKTLMLGAAISPTLVFPHTYNTDAHRAPFPQSDFGNRTWGNCVKVGEANQVLRMERIEQRRTLPITEEIVVDAYKKQTGAQSPGDAKDHGLVMLDNNVLWRKQGFAVKSRSYKIAAFGELDVGELDQLRAGIYLFRGVQLGLALPEAAQGQVTAGRWDVVPGNDPSTRAGSWGGHAVYCYGYDTDGFYVKSWGMTIYITNAFMTRYCDEAWGVVDDFDEWLKRSNKLDVQKIIQHLRDIGASNIQ